MNNIVSLVGRDLGNRNPEKSWLRKAFSAEPMDHG